MIGAFALMTTGCAQTDGAGRIPENGVEEQTDESAAVSADMSEDNDSESADSSDISDVSSAEVGKYITFGKYEQDNNNDNGAEPIEWLVLDHQSGRTLLLSRYGLDGIWYSYESDGITWENSNIRSWLNTVFYDAAFGNTEKDRIVQITNENPDSTSFWKGIGREVDSSIGGNDTQDNVFLLSIDEVNTYLGLSAENNQDCACMPTAYADSKGVYSPGAECWWWLRSPGNEQCYAAVVDDYGRALSEYVYHADRTTPAVRPAIWVGEGEHGEIADLPAYIEPGRAEENVQQSSVNEEEALTSEGWGGLYSGSNEDHYYYVWLEKGSSSSASDSFGTILLLWEGNTPYEEGSELMQDSPHDIYMSDVDDGYTIKPGWDNGTTNVLTIDSDEFGNYSGKIFCFGFWLDKDDSMIYNGTTLRYKD